MGSKAIPEKAVLLGLDLGGTAVKALVYEWAGGRGRVLSHSQRPSEASRSPEHVRRVLLEFVHDLRAEYPAIEAIGIGCAGSVDGARGVVRNSPNFAGWHEVPLREWLASDTGLRVSVENDANCAVYGEWKAGGGVGCRHLVLITLGTGVGSGVITDGRLLRGATGTAAELGHTSMYANGVECPCGHRGCFERYCSATALSQAAGGLACEEVFEKHPAVVDTFLENLIVGLTNVANTFDPEKLLLGGGMSPALQKFLPRIREGIRKRAFPAVGANMKVELAEHGNQSGGIGAALLSVDDGSAARPANLG